MKRVWIDYMGGTMQDGHRQWFFAATYDDQGIFAGYDSCWRMARRTNNKVTYYGPGYPDPWSTETVVPEQEFATWDAQRAKG
jgi:hypothetical protein